MTGKEWVVVCWTSSQLIIAPTDQQNVAKWKKQGPVQITRRFFSVVKGLTRFFLGIGPNIRRRRRSDWQTTKRLHQFFFFPANFFVGKKWRQGFEFRESESLLRSQSAPTNLIVLNQMNVIWKCPINSSTDPRCIRLSGVRHQSRCEPGPWSWVRISSWIMFLLMDQIRSINYKWWVLWDSSALQQSL